MELSKIPQSVLKDLMTGLLQFNLSKRIQFKDVAKLLRCNQEIQDFYSSIKTYKPKQNIIDQKIFFRESRQDKNSTYILSETALIESLILLPNQSESFQSTSSDSFKQSDSFRQSNKKIKIIEDTLMKNQLKLEQSKFQCFKDVLSILNDYNQDIAPELSLTILALNFGIIYFYLHLIKELENQNSSYFYQNELEMKLWISYKQQNEKLIKDDIQKLKSISNSFIVSFNREYEIKCVQNQIIKAQSDIQDFLQQQLFKIQYFNKSLSNQENTNKFLDAYRTQCLYMLLLINENLDFTMNIQTSLKLRQSLLLCAFADILFKPQLECHKQITKILNVNEISHYEQFNEYIKIDHNSFNDWLLQVINYFQNHEVGRKYMSELNQLL